MGREGGAKHKLMLSKGPYGEGCCQAGVGEEGGDTFFFNYFFIGCIDICL